MQHETKNHVLEPKLVGDVIHYLYSKIPYSGVKPTDHVPAPDKLWKEHGYLDFFDQKPYINKAL